jgi:hypothetical protein
MHRLKKVDGPSKHWKLSHSMSSAKSYVSWRTNYTNELASFLLFIFHHLMMRQLNNFHALGSKFSHHRLHMYKEHF